MKRRLMALILACGALASNAPALVYMTDENGNSIGSSHYSITYVGGNTYNVIIKSHHRSGGANSYFVIHGSGGENIGTISVQAPSDGYSTNYVVIRVLSDDGTSGIFDLDSVYQTTGGTEGAVLNLVDIEGSVGSVSIDTIGNIFAVGSIDGPIESTGEHWNGGITEIRCTGTGSSILGDVISAGSIQKIDAQGGDVGQDTSLITISCTALTGFVRGKNVYADITASSGDVGLIQSTKILGGELVASISAQNILNPAGGDGILVNGDLDLTLTLAGGTNPSIRDDVIITGGDFTQNSSISAWGIGDAGEFSIIKTGAGGWLSQGRHHLYGQSLAPEPVPHR